MLLPVISSAVLFVCRISLVTSSASNVKASWACAQPACLFQSPFQDEMSRACFSCGTWRIRSSELSTNSMPATWSFFKFSYDCLRCSLASLPPQVVTIQPAKFSRRSCSEPYSLPVSWNMPFYRRLRHSWIASRAANVVSRDLALREDYNWPISAYKGSSYSVRIILFRS